MPSKRYKDLPPKRMDYFNERKPDVNTWSLSPEGTGARSRKAASIKISAAACKRTSFLTEPPKAAVVMQAMKTKPEDNKSRGRKAASTKISQKACKDKPFLILS